MTNLRKRVLALIMAAAMVLGMIPLSAALDASKLEQAKMQIEGFQDDQSGGAHFHEPVLGQGGGTNEGPTIKNGRVSTTRGIAPTGIEDLFDITLGVTTTQKVEAVASMPDAAVALTIDVSGSMGECAICAGGRDVVCDKGHRTAGIEGLTGVCLNCDNALAPLSYEYVHKADKNSKCTNTDPSDARVAYKDSRAGVAETAAKKFATSFGASGKEAGAKRLISLRTFSYKAWEVSFVVNNKHVMWVDVATAEGLAAFNVAMDGALRPDGVTNVTAGLAAASKSLDYLFDDYYKEVRGNVTRASTYVLLLGDGEPSASNGGPGIEYPAIGGIEYPKGANKKHYTDAERWVSKIRADGTKFMAAYTGTDARDKGYKWFQTLYKDCALASNVESLVDAFETTIALIRLNAKAWIVTDPISYAFQVNTGVALGENVSVARDESNRDTLTWILRNDTPKVFLDGKEVDLGSIDPDKLAAGKYEFRYSTTYRVEMRDGWKEAPAAGTDAFKALNVGERPAKLSYFLTDKDGNFTNENGEVISIKDKTEAELEAAALLSMKFKSPRMRGYFGTVNATKLSVDGVPLEGAQFTATAVNGGKQVFTADANGVVKLKLSSGASYTITETKAPEGFLAEEGKNATIAVKYGVATVEGPLLEAAENNGFKVINARDPKNIKVEVEKKWLGVEGAGNGKDVTVKVYPYTYENQMMKLGELADTLTITGAGTVSSKDLPSVDVATGKAISYTVVEDTSTEYEQVNMVGENNKFTITNLQNGKQNITISKTWLGPEQSSVMVQLYRDGIAYGEAHKLSKGAWSKVIENVPTFRSDKSGEASVYTVNELDEQGKPVEGGSVTLGGVRYTVSAAGTAITNTVEQGTAATVAGSKLWNVAALDEETQADLKASIVLYADNVATGTTDVVTMDKTEYSFSALPKYAIPGTMIGDQPLADIIGADKMDGHEIKYTVAEPSTGSNDITSVKEGNLFTNTLTGVTDVPVEKIWADEGNKYNSRPDSVTLVLMAGEKEIGSRTVEAKDVTIMQDVQTGADEATGETIMTAQEVKTGEKSWDGVVTKHTFKNVPKFDDRGAFINYTVLERGAVDGKIAGKGDYKYSSTLSGNAANGFTVTNTLNGEMRTISIEKKWLDKAADDTRTAKATIELKLDGKLVDSFVTSKNESKAFEFWYGGGTIEVTEATVEGYEAAKIVKNNDNSYTVSNQIQQDTSIEIKGSKAWVGGDASARPAVHFVLYQNGVATNQIKKLPADAANASIEDPYAFSFTGLEKYKFDGDKISENSYYIVEEMEASALKNVYDPSDTTEPDGVHKFVNTFNPRNKTIAGKKTWIAGNYNPEVTVGLLVADEVKYTKKTKELAYAFTVPSYTEQGKEISYTVRELDAKGVPIAAGGTYEKDGKTFTVSYVGNDIYNTLPQSQDVTITVTKIWQGPAGDSVTFTLSRSANNAADTSFAKQLTLTAWNADEQGNGNWEGSFDQQDKIDSKGHEYSYTVQEGVVESELGHKYKAVETEEQKKQNVFVNQIEQTTRAFSVFVNWKDADGNNSSSSKPEVEVQLYAGTEPMGEKVKLNEGNKFAHNFENLPTYAEQTHQPIVYTVKEIGEINDTLRLKGNNYGVTYAYKTTDPSLGSFDASITNALKSVDSFSYKTTRYYTETVNGVAQPTVTVSDENWTTGTQDETININTANGASYGGQTYGLVKASVNGKAQPGASFDLVLAKLADGPNTYEIDIYYALSRTTGGGGGGGGGGTTPGGGVIGGGGTDIGDVAPPLAELPDVTIPDEEPPLAELPDDMIIEDPEVPLGDAPRTGDESHLALWAVLMGLSGLSIAALLGGKKRKREDA